MAKEKNISNALWSKQEKMAIIGDSLVRLRSFGALEKLSQHKMDNFFILYIQSSIILGLALISSYLWYLLKSNYQLIDNNSINIDASVVCYSLFGLPFLLMSFSVFNKLLTKIWMIFLSFLFIFLTLSSMLYYQPHQSFPFIVPIFDNSFITIAAIASVFISVLVFLIWRLFFWGAVIVLLIINGSLAINLSHTKSPIISLSPTNISSKADADSNIIHIIVNDHINIPYFMEVQKKEKNVVNQVIDFYQKNDFKLFPKAYSTYSSGVTETNNIFNFETLTPYTIINKSDTSFINRNNGIDAFLSDDKYLNAISKSNYNINIYQNYGVNLCYGENFLNIKKCYTEFPINSITTKDNLLKAYLTSLLSNTMFNNISPQVSYKDMPTIVYQRQLLEEAKNDILRAKGKNFFLIQVSSLKSPYIYDEKCNITKETTGLSGYTNQLSCTYKMLDDFMSTLKASGVLNHSKVIIHGLGGANINSSKLTKGKTYSLQESFIMAKNMNMSIFAYYSPSNKNFSIDFHACNISSLFMQAMGRKNVACKGIDIKEYSLESVPIFKAMIANWLNSIKAQNL